MLFVVLSGFILALLVLPFGKHFKGKRSYALSILPFSLFIYFLSKVSRVCDAPILESTRWVPSINIELSFYLDGLSLLFSLLITGIGGLVFLYSSSYLKKSPDLDRFWAYLSFFMGSMLGLVLSDNAVTLFIFWELTSISSFFLIGYQNNNPGSRKAAMTALSITGLGGLFLFAGLLFIGSIVDSYSLSAWISNASAIKSNSAYFGILILVFLGAFTKSAQFPFHFWLPAAMKAPTPVSTYLHSATMVKAGIYLIARLSPVLGETPAWNNTLLIVGGVTMVYAAIHSLFRSDLKSILAYTTISALGIIMFLMGLGHQEAWVAAVTFILIHALYKATLFLMTGAIDYSTGTRQIHELGGLRTYMWPIALAGILAALSHGGFPPTFGFIGKDLIYESTLHAQQYPAILSGIAIITNICLVFAGLLVGVKPFIGKKPEGLTILKKPVFRIWFPPMVLGGASLLFGLAPQVLDHSIVQGAAASIAGSAADTAIHLKLWHGFNLVLGLSALTLFFGIALYVFYRPKPEKARRPNFADHIAPEAIYRMGIDLSKNIALVYTRLFQNGYLRYYLLTILVFVILLFGREFFNTVGIHLNWDNYASVSFYEGAIAAIMFISILSVVFANSRLVAIISLGVVGYSLSLFFMDFGAPDLAMTQFAIDTLTVVLFVLVLYRLPKYLKYSNTAARIRDGIVALSFGGLITFLALAIIQEPINTEISQYYADNAYILAKGKNIVNVILVDFRGIDTFGEITVITVAAIGVYGLLHLTIRPGTRAPHNHQDE
jgi:multicomponent Na+:H+ antiporter subunit A